MKVYVWTRHTLRSGAMRAELDGDQTVQLVLPSTVVRSDENSMTTNWLDREELLNLRAVINRALKLLS